MGKEYVDVLGLSTTAVSPGDYAAALGLTGELLDSESARMGLLARLRAGAGVTVYTGPEGAPFWSLVSRECHVRVVPGGDEYEERASTDAEWAYRAVGLNTTVSGQLLRRKTPPPDSHRYYGDWLAAKGLLSALDAADGCEPEIVEDFPTRRSSVAGTTELLATNGDPLALDWEWDMETAEPTGLSHADAADAAYCVLEAEDAHESPDAARGLVSAFSEYLRAGRPAILHGARADLGTQYEGNALDLVDVANIDDTMVMAYLAGEPVLKLKELTPKYLGREPTEFPGNLSGLPSALAVRYAGADARNTYDLFRVLATRLVERGQWAVYQEIERPLIPIIVSMEQEGVPVDIDEVRRQYRDTVAIEMGVRYAIRDHYGFDVADDNGRTLETNQARAFVAHVRGSDPGGVDQRLLTTFPEGEIDLLLLYRRSRTLRRNFLGRALRYHYAYTHPGHERHLFKSRSRWTKKGELTDLGKFLEWKRRFDALPDTSLFRYFPRFNQAGSVDGDNHAAPRSGRLSSTDPNFTNQTRGALRKTYVPPPGCYWWSWDYSGLELHIAADTSQDANMVRMLSETCPDPGPKGCEHKPKHGDVHSALQYKVFDLTGRLLDRALVIKPFNFEQLYGGGAQKGVEIVAKGRVYITVETAQDVIAAHHELFDGFWVWRERKVIDHRRDGYAATLAGRRRYIPELRSRDPERLAYADRAGINHIVQGTGADIVKTAMHRVVPVLRKFNAHMCAQVHDEIDGWVPNTVDWEELKGEVERLMTITLPNGLRLKVEGSHGSSWGEAH